MKSDNIVESKSFDFAVRVVNLYKYLTNEKKEFVLSKQLLRSGTSIGANICEAQKAQTSPDFISKLYVALKEANETSYWLRLLNKTEYLTQAEFVSLHNDIDEIIALLMSITKSVKNKI